MRRLIQTTREQQRAVPTTQLVRPAAHVQGASGITIDFAAERDLGTPMVVVRVPVPLSGDNKLSRLHRLTARENEIAALVSDGLSNKQIAQRLQIALATVKDHMHRLLAKTQLPNRAALAAAYRGRVPKE